MSENLSTDVEGSVFPFLLSGKHWSLQAFGRHLVEHICRPQRVNSVFETYKSTGKDIVLAHTLYTKGLQIMKCDQFCLCTEYTESKACSCELL